MAALTLGVVAVMDVVAAAAFLGVAGTLARRAVPRQDRLAVRAFVLWWTAMAAYMLLRAALIAHAAFFGPSVVLFLMGRALGIALLTIAVWGLVFHITYLFSGSRGLAVPLGFFYGAAGLLFYVAGFVPVPERVVVESWQVALEGEGETLLYRLVYAVYGLSIIASVIAYASILPKLTDKMQRLRVVLVSGGLLVWVGSGLGAFMAGNDLAKFGTLVLMGLLVAASVTIAYHPPGIVVDLVEGKRRSRQERQQDMSRRASELI